MSENVENKTPETKPDEKKGPVIIPPKDGKEHEFGDVPFIDLKTLELNREIADLIPEEIARKIEGVIVGKPSDDTIIAAVKDPSQIYIYDSLEYSTHNKYKVKLLKADPDMIDLAIEFVYKTPAFLQNSPWSEWLEGKKFKSTQLKVDTKDTTPGDDDEKEVTGTVVDLANKIIAEAISLGASDVHFEMFEKGMVIRYRLDGILHTMDSIQDVEEALALIKRIKIMANMDISLDRVTQDGRISVQLGQNSFDLRVSIVPVPAGESIVTRLLNKSAFNLSLKTIGFSEKHLKTYRSMVSRPYGVILVSGPTGSGKTTTLYASLKEINRPDRKLITVEDPIEYEMPGIVQVQVNMAPREEDRKVTFAKALREFLRQDPDVILVGEIRDNETAEISVQAAQTGHLVLSTIHTNDAVGIINRLKDMDIASYLISQTLIGGIAQRLVRRLCDNCRKPVQEPPEFDEYREFIDKVSNGKPTFYEPVGCDKCRRSGFRGRVGIFEILIVSDLIRDKIESGATSGDILRMAKKEGMQNLIEDGIIKAAEGITSPSEVKRVCMMDITY